MKSKFIVAGFILILVAISGSAYANHAWGKYHWNLSTAQTEIAPLQIAKNITPEWDASLTIAATDWNQSVLKNTVIIGTNNRATCTPTPGRIEVCNHTYGENSWLGIAQVWAYRGKEAHIAQATTLLNDTYFSLPQYNTTAWRQMVMCQEVGHTFGLAHQDENFNNTNLGSCMDYTSDPTGTLDTNGTSNNEHPNPHDFEMLKSIYAHLNDASGNVKGGGKGGSRQTPVSTTEIDPASWGQAVAQDAQGKDSLFVRNLDNGMQLITHVLWVPETHTTEDTHQH